MCRRGIETREEAAQQQEARPLKGRRRAAARRRYGRLLLNFTSITIVYEVILFTLVYIVRLISKTSKYDVGDADTAKCSCVDCCS